MSRLSKGEGTMRAGEPLEIEALRLITPDHVSLSSDAGSIACEILFPRDGSLLERITFSLKPGHDYPERQFAEFFSDFAIALRYILQQPRRVGEDGALEVIDEIGNSLRELTSKHRISGPSAPFSIDIGPTEEEGIGDLVPPNVKINKGE